MQPKSEGVIFMDIPAFPEIARWRAADARDGSGQMALDEVMLRRADRPVLRIYRWARREVTFGYPQKWTEARDFAGERPITRRCTGGGFVEHGDDVTIAFAVPAKNPFSRLTPGETYHRIHEALRMALGGALRLATATDCTCGPACFTSPTVADVLSDAIKVGGGAQRRSRDGLLYQGSIQGIAVDEDFDNRFAMQLALKMTEWSPPSDWQACFEELIVTRYASDDWNHRR